MKPIEKKIETLQDIAAEIAGQLQAIQITRGVADAEIGDGGLTLPTCQQMARLMAQLHVNTAKLHNGGHIVHTLMALVLPPDSNEGNKSGWPPSP